MDERHNKASASKLDYLFLCPGRHLAEQKVERKDTPSAKRGEKVHLVLEGKLPITELCESQQITTQRMMDAEALMVDEFGFTDVVPIREGDGKRLWLGDIFSGRLDAIYLHDQEALIVDYKSGWYEPTPAKDSWQLRGQSVLAWENYGVDKITSAIIGSRGATWTQYDREDLVVYKGEIEGICEVCEDKNAPRYPSIKACAFCAFAAKCPERKAWLKANIFDAESASVKDWQTTIYSMLSLKKSIEELEKKAINKFLAGFTIEGYGIRQDLEWLIKSDVTEGWIKENREYLTRHKANKIVMKNE